MNIGIVTTWFERGAAYVSKQYIDALKDKHNIYIYARGGESYAQNNSDWDKSFVTWGKRVNNNIPSYIDINDFANWIKKNSIDIVFFNEQHCWTPVLYCCQNGIKTGAYIDYYTETTIPFFKLYDFLICNTKRHMNAFNWHRQVYYIPWGTDTKLFKPQSYSGVNNEKITFFHSSGYNPYRKGTDFIIKSFSNLKQNAKLIIHSQVDLEDFFPELEDEIKVLKESNKLEVINKTVTAPGLYHLGDVYLYPSRLDGIGLTIAEALSCGLPVITSDNPPMNEFIDSKISATIKISKLFSRYDGYYWPSCEIDIDSLTNSMELYAKNFDKISELKLNARTYAENNLDWVKNSKDLSNIFEEIKTVSVNEKSDIFDTVKAFERSRSIEKHKIMRVIGHILYKLNII